VTAPTTRRANADAHDLETRSREDWMRRIAYLIVLGACGLMTQASAIASPDLAVNPNPALFPKQSHPYGADLSTWADRESQWAYAQPLAHNPVLDQTGADCAVGQAGPVWFIPRIAGPRVFSGSRTCTIPVHKALFLEIGAYVDPYPCPDPNFHPAPGQSLYDFLIADAGAFMDGVNRLEVSLDGRSFGDVLSYRFHSADLFSLTGDLSLQATFDSCITGSPQPAIVDGFFMMFKPLEPGAHVIRVFGTDVRGAVKTYTYYLNVE
jgi:hypothetical protein